MTRQREHARLIGLLIVVVLALGVEACGSDGEGGGSVGSEESQEAAQAGEVQCGRPFGLPAPGALRLTGEFPERAPAGQPILNGTVEVHSEDAVRGVAAGAADAFLVSEGRVVTTPLPQDAVGVRWELAAGESKRVPAMASLLSCEANREPVPAGDYELYARFVLTADDGTPEAVFGGPWPLQVG